MTLTRLSPSWRPRWTPSFFSELPLRAYNGTRAQISTPDSYSSARLAGIPRPHGHQADTHLLFRRAATFVHKIMRGESPADMPVEQPTKFTLVLNFRTARAIGVSVPELFLLRADEVIE